MGTYYVPDTVLVIGESVVARQSPAYSSLYSGELGEMVPKSPLSLKSQTQVIPGGCWPSRAD